MEGDGLPRNAGNGAPAPGFAEVKMAAGLMKVSIQEFCARFGIPVPSLPSRSSRSSEDCSRDECFGQQRPSSIATIAATAAVPMANNLAVETPRAFDSVSIRHPADLDWASHHQRFDETAVFAMGSSYDVIPDTLLSMSTHAVAAELLSLTSPVMTWQSNPRPMIDDSVGTIAVGDRELMGLPASHHSDSRSHDDLDASAQPAPGASNQFAPDILSPQSDSNSTSSSSSWVIPTPFSGSPQSQAATVLPSAPITQASPLCPAEETEQPLRLPPLVGCSKVWDIPPRTRKRKSSGESPPKRKADSANSVGGPARRGPFRDDARRQMTAQTRENHCCIRCRMLRQRCEPDPENPAGSCLDCLRLAGSRRRPALCKLPCLRWLITDASLYREQDRPHQEFSRRWQSMDLVDVTVWASAEVKRIFISPMRFAAPYEVEVREFVPVEGDVLDRRWTGTDGVQRTHWVPRYTYADVNKVASHMGRALEASIAAYINAYVGGSDDLLWTTYQFAFALMDRTKISREGSLLKACLILWVACRKTSNPERVYGDELLGGSVIDDPESVYYRAMPIPLVMAAQDECIMYTRILRPLSRQALRLLNDLVLENKQRNWLTIYLSIFILLHSCAMTARRNWEYARQIKLQRQFVNPEAIRRHQVGAQVMLAHFHYLNKGVLPFRLVYDSAGLEKLSKAAELSSDELGFVRKTSQLLQDPLRAQLMKTIKIENHFFHDLYWVSQLYDEEWKPGPIAV